MPNLKISELASAGALAGTELVEVVQGGVNKQTTTQDIADLGGGGGGAVDSVNGQTGVVVLDAGDVGADPAGTAAALLTSSITNGDTTHAPNGDAVFDALALKFTTASASTTAQGIIELATQAEGNVGTDALRAVVPSVAKGIADKIIGSAPFRDSTSGTGTEASPYVSTVDSKAGLQTNVNLLGAARGGRIILSADRYDVTDTAGVVIQTECIDIEGVSAGKQANPNGESEGLSGTKIRFAGNCFHYSRATSPRISGHIRKVYLHTATAKQAASFNGALGVGTKAIWQDGFVEQCNFEEVKVLGADYGVYSNTASTFFDVINYSRCLFIGCNYGMYYGSSSEGLYNQLHDNVIADNVKHGLYVNDNNLYVHWAVSGNSFVRNSGASGIADNPSNVFFGADSSTFYGNMVISAGLDWIPTPTQYTADGMIVSGDANAIVGNIVKDNLGGGSTCGMRVTGNSNFIIGNKFTNNTADMILDASASSNNVWVTFGTTVTDNGVRNFVNGISRNAGDPNTTGNWNGITKHPGVWINDTSNSFYYHYPLGSSSITYRIRHSNGQFQVQNSATGASDLTALGLVNTTITSSFFNTTAAHASFASSMVYFTNATNGFVFSLDGTTVMLRMSGTSFTVKEANNFVFGTTTGTKLGTATSQKIGFWNATPVIQPTTGITAAAFVANTSAIADDTATFGGYTMGKVVAALKQIGLLA